VQYANRSLVAQLPSLAELLFTVCLMLFLFLFSHATPLQCKSPIPKQTLRVLRFWSHVSAHSQLALKVDALATSASSAGAASETLFRNVGTETLRGSQAIFWPWKDTSWSMSWFVPMKILMFLVEKYGYFEDAMSLVVRSLGVSMSREDMLVEYREV
jgi:hypothetical protein